MDAKNTHCRWCSAPTCKNHRNKRPDLAFFRFPADPETSKKWVVNTGRRDLETKPARCLCTNNVLCEIHFERHCFRKTKRKLLKRDAVPTIFGGVPPLPIKMTSTVSTAPPLASALQTASPLSTEPQTVSPLLTEPQTVSPFSTQPKTVLPLSTEPQTASPLETVPQTISSLSTAPQTDSSTTLQTDSFLSTAPHTASPLAAAIVDLPPPPIKITSSRQRRRKQISPLPLSSALWMQSSRTSLSTANQTASSPSPLSTVLHTTSSPSPLSTALHTTSSPSPLSTALHTTSSPSPLSTALQTTSSPSLLSTALHTTSLPSPLSTALQTTPSPSPLSTALHTTSSPSPLSTAMQTTSPLANAIDDFPMATCKITLSRQRRRKQILPLPLSTALWTQSSPTSLALQTASSSSPLLSTAFQMQTALPVAKKAKQTASPVAKKALQTAAPVAKKALQTVSPHAKKALQTALSLKSAESMNTPESPQPKKRKLMDSKNTHCRWCAAPNCKNHRNKCPDLSFFRFPLDPETSKKWIANARRKDLESKTEQHLYTSNVLCEVHFEPCCFRKTKKRKLLLKAALPTIFDFSSPPLKSSLSRRRKQRQRKQVLHLPLSAALQTTSPPSPLSTANQTVSPS